MADNFFGSIHDPLDDGLCPLLRLRHAVCSYVQHPLDAMQRLLLICERGWPNTQREQASNLFSYESSIYSSECKEEGRRLNWRLQEAVIVFLKELNPRVLPNEPLFSSLYIKSVSLKALILASLSKPPAATSSSTHTRFWYVCPRQCLSSPPSARWEL
jgi:hypothetical protein